MPKDASEGAAVVRTISLHVPADGNRAAVDLDVRLRLRGVPAAPSRWLLQASSSVTRVLSGSSRNSATVRVAVEEPLHDVLRVVLADAHGNPCTPPADAVAMLGVTSGDDSAGPFLRVGDEKRRWVALSRPTPAPDAVEWAAGSAAAPVWLAGSASADPADVVVLEVRPQVGPRGESPYASSTLAVELTAGPPRELAVKFAGVHQAGLASEMHSVGRSLKTHEHLMLSEDKSKKTNHAVLLVRDAAKNPLPVHDLVLRSITPADTSKLKVFWGRPKPAPASAAAEAPAVLEKAVTKLQLSKGAQQVDGFAIPHLFLVADPNDGVQLEHTLTFTADVLQDASGRTQPMTATTTFRTSRDPDLVVGFVVGGDAAPDGPQPAGFVLPEIKVQLQMEDDKWGPRDPSSVATNALTCYLRAPDGEVIPMSSHGKAGKLFAVSSAEDGPLPHAELRKAGVWTVNDKWNAPQAHWHKLGGDPLVCSAAAKNIRSFEKPLRTITIAPGPVVCAALQGAGTMPALPCDNHSKLQICNALILQFRDAHGNAAPPPASPAQRALRASLRLA